MLPQRKHGLRNPYRPLAAGIVPLPQASSPCRRHRPLAAGIVPLPQALACGWKGDAGSS